MGMLYYIHKKAPDTVLFDIKKCDFLTASLAGLVLP
jgi:hypothetical protein